VLSYITAELNTVDVALFCCYGGVLWFVTCLHCC